MKSKFKLGIVIILILAVGGYLRFANLTKRGIFSWDEGHYVGVLYTLSAGIKYIFRVFVLGENLGKFSDYMLTYGVNHYLAAKPTFFVLGLITTLFTGLKVYTLQVVSAAAGLSTVGIIYLIAHILRQRRAGIFASFALAVSYFHIYYSRTAMPHIAAIFFAYLALLLYLNSIHKNETISGRKIYNKYLLWSGFITGIAFSCHYNLYWIPFIFWFCEILYYTLNFKKKPLLSKIRRFFIFSLCMVIPLVSYELLLRAVKTYIYLHPHLASAVGGNSGQGIFYDYFEQLFFQIKYLDNDYQFSNRFFYIHMLFLKEGVLVVSIFLIGLVCSLYNLWKKFAISEFLMLSFFIIPFVLTTLNPHIPNMRTFIVVLPAFFWFVGRGFISMEDFIKRIHLPHLIKPQYVTVLLAIFVLSHSLSLSREYLNQTSGYNEALQYIKTHEGIKHFSSNPIITRIYAGRKNTYDIRSYYPSGQEDSGQGNFSLDHVIMLYNKGFRYLILDHLRYRYSNALVSAAENISPVFSAFHSSDADMFERGYEGIKYAKTCPKRIEVYTLEDLLNQISISKKH